MAASDPTPYVATPTGTLQGVAAFSWDGSAWQPSGRAGPDVATPTGVLQGVAPFSWDGAAWQPSGRAQPGVATPSGVLDGIAVYTWSGSAWTPASGTATPSTPSGALRGVAAFSWDGAAWQPAAQARPSVPTPYGVLDGVAFFNWGGSAWQAGAAVPGGATLDLSFLSGALDPRITFTRASAATYFDSSGTMQTAASGAPRFDYDPATHVLRGLLIEEARTNIWLQSADASNAAWAKTSSGPPAAPVVTANQATAPDGTPTAARVVLSTCTGAQWCELTQTINVTANPYTQSVWLRGNAGGEVLYLMATVDAVAWQRLQVTLTTVWQRFSLSTTNLTAATWFFQIGFDRRDAAQTNTTGCTVFVWGGQVEQGAFPTSYIPTTAAAVTRAVDVCSMPTAAWYQASPYSLMFEVFYPSETGTGRVIGGLSDSSSANAGFFQGQYWLYGGGTAYGAGTTLPANAISKLCGTVNNSALLIQAGVNGVAGPQVAMSSTPGPATTLGFGTPPWALGGSQLNGWVRRVRYWPRALSNAELQSVTT